MNGWLIDGVEVDQDVAQWLAWKAKALTQGRVDTLVAQLLHGMMEEERVRRQLGLEDLEPAPDTAWGPLLRERIIRAHPG